MHATETGYSLVPCCGLTVRDPDTVQLMMTKQVMQSGEAAEALGDRRTERAEGCFPGLSLTFCYCLLWGWTISSSSPPPRPPATILLILKASHFKVMEPANHRLKAQKMWTEITLSSSYCCQIFVSVAKSPIHPCIKLNPRAGETVQQGTYFLSKGENWSSSIHVSVGHAWQPPVILVSGGGDGIPGHTS